MIDTTNLANKPLQDLLRDQINHTNLMRRVATKLGIDVSGKRVHKFRSIKIKDDIMPPDYPEKLCRLQEILWLYIDCKKCWAPVSSTTQENLLFCEFKALEKKLLEHNQNR